MKILLCLLLAAGLGAEEQEEVWDPALTDETMATFFAYSMVSMGDLDGDGAGDFAVSSPRECPDRTMGGWDRVMSRGKFAGQPLPDFGVVRAISGASGKVIWGHSEPRGFGETLACMGDVNGDGTNDLAIGTSHQSPGYFVCSGVDGSVIFSKSEYVLERSWRLASVDDVSGDGVRDLVVGRPGEGVVNLEERPPSRVEIHSGSDGSLLLEIDVEQFIGPGDAPGEHQIGRSVWGLSDLDGDGKGEIAFTLHVGRDWPPSKVIVASSADGCVLREIEPERDPDGDGPALAVVGDLDRDGLLDWVVGSSESYLADYTDEELGPDGLPEEWFSPQGDAVVRSAATCEPLFSLNPEERTPRFGHAVAGGGDFNADGVTDLLVTDYGGGMTFSGSCFVYSGADGSLIRKHEGELSWDYGASLIVVDDLDGDDCADYVVGCMNDYPGSGGTGFAIVYSGRTGEVKYFLGGKYWL